MEVEDRLPRHSTARVDEVDAVSRKAPLGAYSQALRGKRNSRKIVRVDRQEVSRVLTRYDKRMASRRGIDVHERNSALVFINDRRRQFADNDLAEDAIGIGHLPKPSRDGHFEAGINILGLVEAGDEHLF